MNQPWECPRCNRMNAPFIPHCDCKTNNTASSAALTGSLTVTNQKCLTCQGMSRNGNQCLECFLRFGKGISQMQCKACGQPHAGYTCEEYFIK